MDREFFACVAHCCRKSKMWCESCLLSRENVVGWGQGIECDCIDKDADEYEKVQLTARAGRQVTLCMRCSEPGKPAWNCNQYDSYQCPRCPRLFSTRSCRLPAKLYRFRSEIVRIHDVSSRSSRSYACVCKSMQGTRMEKPLSQHGYARQDATYLVNVTEHGP